MYWTIVFFGHTHLMPETRVPLCYRETLDLAAAMPTAIQPKAALDPNPPVPAQALKVGHQGCLSKAPTGQKNHRTASRQHQGRSLQQLTVGLECHLRPAVLEDTPHQRHRAAAIDYRPPDQTVRIPYHGGI